MSEKFQKNSLEKTDPRQSELQQLQREYRHMELNRRAYAEESQAVLRKQQITIDKLRKDNESLKNDIAIILRGSNRPISLAHQEFLQTLTDKGDNYANSIEYENENIKVMEEQIQIMKRKILQQRKSMGGVNAAKENNFMIDKQIRILENRLDKSLIKFNEAVSNNKKLRDKIDDLRRERVVFENIYRKMERELQDRKKQMAEIIEISNQAYEQRDTFQMEIAAIEQSNRKEHEEFEEQMATLGQMLENELQLPTPGTSLLNRSKTLSRLGTSPSRPRMSRGSQLGASGDFKDTLGQSSSSPELGMTEIDYKERAQNFEEAYNKIKAATGISDIDELVKTFIKNEEHNFSLFNYVSEQNNEIEKIEEQIQQLKDEEQKFAQESGNDVNQHKEILKDLENKLKSSDLMAEKYESRCQDLNRIIESLKRGMQSIFSKFDFELEEGSNLVVTDVNMVTYLGYIEKKANQLLQQYTNLKNIIKASTTQLNKSKNTEARENQDDENELSNTFVTVLGTGPKVPMGHDLVHVNPPKADDYRSDESDGDDDEDTRPLTRDELKSRTLNRLQKRTMNNSTSILGSPSNTASNLNINNNTANLNSVSIGSNPSNSSAVGSKKRTGSKK